MNQFDNISLFLISTLLLLTSCNSENQNKIESKNNVQLAQRIFSENKKYSSEDTSSIRALVKALSYLDKAIELDPTNIQAYQDKVTILTVLERSSEQIKPLLKLLELKPDFAEGHLQLGLLYETFKNYDSANSAYRQAGIGFLKRTSSDNRNHNLVFVEFLITKSKSSALEKLKELDIKDPELKKAIILEIDEWEKGNIL